MTDEISSDVEYLINQLNERKNNKNELKVIYSNEIINGENNLTKEETQKEPIIQINKQSEENLFETLVCILLFIK
jgi:hypothetical protein